MGMWKNAMSRKSGQDGAVDETEAAFPSESSKSEQPNRGRNVMRREWEKFDELDQ